MNSASLADMNARIAAKAGNRKKRTASSVGEVSRFRPNFLVGGSGIAAYAEDDWQTVCIGTPSFFTAGEALQMAYCVCVTVRCSRCNRHSAHNKVDLPKRDPCTVGLVDASHAIG